VACRVILAGLTPDLAAPRITAEGSP
jgi:hypothetical protein